MELIGDVGHVESRFGPFGESVSVGARLVHDLHTAYHRLEKHFGHTRWNCLVTWARLNLVSICLPIVPILTPDRCTV
jgi:hypothetical protein